MIIDRYLIREIIPNFFIGLLVFTFVMLMNQILLLSEALITRGVEFNNIFLIIFYTLPALTVLTIPMSLLLGILLGLGRLNADSELTVMRTSGISLYRLLLPVLGLSAFFWFICSYLIQVSVPWGNYSLNRLIYQIMTTNPASELKPRIFYDEFPNMVLYVQDIPTVTEERSRWEGVLIFDESDSEKPRLLLAKEGYVQQKNQKGELELMLINGSWHEVNPRRAEDYTFVYFLENIFTLPTLAKFGGGEIPKGDRDQTIDELKKSIAENREKKLPTNYLEVEIQKKYAIPFACVVFGFLALAVAVTSKKGGRSSAYAIAIGIILIYYVFLIGGERFADAGTVSPWLGAWAGNLVLGFIGVLFFLQSNSSLLTKTHQKLQHLIYSGEKYIRVTATPRTREVRVVIRIERRHWSLFSLLDRYVIREFVKNLVLIVIALVLIAELIEATQLVDDLFKNNVGVDVLVQYLKFHFPQWIFYVMPVAALTTTLVTFGTLSKNSEVIAMKASGISLYRISIPVVLLSMFLSLVAFWLQDYILPYTNRIANDYKNVVKTGRQTPTIGIYTHERHWIADALGFYNYEFYDYAHSVMYGFSIYQVNLEEFALNKRIYAREARYVEGEWHLMNGWQRTFARGKVIFKPFRNQKIKLAVKPEFFRTQEEVPAEMSFRDLKLYIERMKERGFEFTRFEVDLQAKLSFPMVSLILTLIALPFSFTFGKRGALFGIGLSIVMGIVFWFFLALTKSLGYLEILGPFLAAWTPNILATLLAMYLLFKLRT